MRPERLAETDHDFALQDSGSIFLLRPLNDAATLWLEENTTREESMYLGDGLAVEARYIEPIIAGLKAYGYRVRGAW